LAKLILLILAGLAVYLFIRNSQRRARRGDDTRRPVEEGMVRCAECGVHHPRSESLLSAGKFYCSAEHERRAHHGR